MEETSLAPEDLVLREEGKLIVALNANEIVEVFIAKRDLISAIFLQGSPRLERQAVRNMANA